MNSAKTCNTIKLRRLFRKAEKRLIGTVLTIAMMLAFVVPLLDFGIGVTAKAVTANDYFDLAAAIAAAPTDDAETEIEITNSFVLTGVLTIASGNNIKITSVSPVELWVNGNRRHFQVNAGGKLTLSGDVTLTRDAGYSGSADRGGGVLVNGAFNMDGGRIKNNSNENGGGAFVGIAGVFTMTGGEISENEARRNFGIGGKGGGLYVVGGEFHLSGSGKISKNIADSSENCGGGGVGASGSVFTMTGGEISENTAPGTGFVGGGGGGVGLEQNCVFTMSGGEIADNAARAFGGGVYVGGGSSFDMSGDALISRNNLTDYPNIINHGGGVCIDNRLSAFNMTGGEISYNAALCGGGVYWRGFPTVSITGGRIIGNEALNAGGGICVQPGTSSKYILPESIFDSLSSCTLGAVEISDNIAGGDGGGIYFHGTKYNSHPGDPRYGYFLEGDSFSILLIDGAIIGDNEALGTYIDNGSLQEGSLGGVGGGIFIMGADFLMRSGEVSRNKAAYAGGGMFLFWTDLWMMDGLIRDNEAEYGGGLYFREKEVPDIDLPGYLLGLGGRTRLYPVGDLLMDGGVISGNTASEDGGGVYSWFGAIEINDGEISDNTAGGNGGGIFTMDHDMLTVAGAVEFSGNTAAAPYWLAPDSASSYEPVSQMENGEEYTSSELKTIHETNIQTTGRSTPPAGYFRYAYNNFDINFIGPGPTPPTNFRKTAAEGAMIKQGEDVAFELSFDMPDDVGNYVNVRIEDEIPAGLTYKSSTMKVGGGVESPVTFTVAGGIASYTLPVTIDHEDETILFTIVFTVDAEPASGYIINESTLYFTLVGDNEQIAGEDDCIVVMAGKTAAPDTFRENGAEIDYSISFTVPDDLSKYEAIKIEDVYTTGLAPDGDTGYLSLGGGAPSPVILTVSPGKLSYTLTASDMIELSSAVTKTIELTLKFKVDGWTTGNITNNADIYFSLANSREKAGGSGVGTLKPAGTGDPGTTPQDPDPVNVAITAKKTVTGGELQAGQFEFELLRNGQRAASASNDEDGNIVFNVTIAAAGTYVYTMRELQTGGGDNWIMDETEHAVTVTVTKTGAALTADVDKTPTFTNVYNNNTGSPTIQIKKTLVDNNGNEIESNEQFTINIYSLDEYEKTDGQPLKQATVTANGEITSVTGLQGGTIYIIWEMPSDDYYAEGYSVQYNGKAPEKVSGTAVMLDIADLSNDVNIFFSLVNRKGSSPGNPGGPGGSLPPRVTIEDGGPPAAIFTADHIAYIIGYAEGDVRPQRNITRAEVATVFYRLLTDNVRADNWAQTNPFPDVLADHWFNNAISVMSKMDVLRGYPDGSFQPNAQITRAELATIAARFSRAMWVTQLNERTFSDISGHWAEEDILYAASIGWVNGYADGTFMPNQPITRAEFMTLVNRMLGRVPETRDDLLDDMKTWADNSDATAWYYLAVQEATNSHTPEYKSGMYVPGLLIEYERWTELTEDRDWAQLEKTWSTAYSG